MLPFSSKKHLIVIAGPTAVGKTALCVQLAKEFDTVVISADSRQFFKELSIGTAKPSKEEMEGVPHFFVDHLSIHDEMNTGMYEQQVLKLLEELFLKHEAVILTGGSGLYIQSICEGIDDMPEVSAETREKLNDEYREFGLNYLQEELKKSDPDYYEIVDLNNPQRLIRALEVCRTTGNIYSAYRARKKVERPFHIIKIALERPREELYARIDQRMDQMLENGLLEEARAFQHLQQLNALQTVGYKEIFDYLKGTYDREECVRLLKRNSRRYAKRQLTWFRRDSEWRWFHPDDKDEIKKYLYAQMS